MLSTGRCIISVTRQLVEGAWGGLQKGTHTVAAHDEYNQYFIVFPIFPLCNTIFTIFEGLKEKQKTEV